MVVVSGTVAVPAFAVSVAIVGAFGAAYQVAGPGANWPTRCQVVNKTPPQFLVIFQVPAPSVGGTVDYMVVTA